ncbi:calcium-binding protein [Candidatus Gracilibacteria bacterium]|nr:calcium-binding protein [Candidatus Gracilibacteria bacterium]
MDEDKLNSIEGATLTLKDSGNEFQFIDALDFTKGSVTLSDGNGSNSLIGGHKSDKLFGGAGNDDLLGGRGLGNDTLMGGSGNDTLADNVVTGDIVASNGGNDVLFGEDGDDELLGQNGNDALSGGAGNDFLNGFGSDGAERDNLGGGSGADIFSLVAVNFTSNSVFPAYQGTGHATISDFSISSGDKIELTGSLNQYKLVLGNIDGDTVQDSLIQLRSNNDLIGVVLDANIIGANVFNFIGSRSITVLF